MPSPPPIFRFSRSLWAFLGFLGGATLILYFTVDRFLIPALQLSHNLDTPARKQLAAISSLVLAVVLVCLLAGLILTVRPARFFFPRKPPTRSPTTYTDAWSESARRMQTPPEEEDGPGPGV